MEKAQKRSEKGEIYSAGKNFTLPPALTAWTNSTSGQDHHDRGDDSDDDDDFDDVGVGDDNEVGIMMYCGKVMSKSC